MLYFLIAIVATTLGAITGFGGGVIIKPVLDMLGDYNVATISVLSSFTVFSMAIVSMLKQVKGIKNKEYEINGKNILMVAIGSVLGGYIGQWCLDYVIGIVNNQGLITIIQNVLFSFIIILIFIYNLLKNKIKITPLKQDVFYITAGLIMGIVSTFLGIGGGPINVAIMMIFFGMSIKSSTIVSIVSILFSQITKLLTITFTTGFLIYDLTMLPYVVVGGILGGYIGAIFNKKFSSKVILIFYNILMFIILGISITNIIINT